jgi:hypothetical protein
LRKGKLKSKFLFSKMAEWKSREKRISYPKLSNSLLYGEIVWAKKMNGIIG